MLLGADSAAEFVVPIAQRPASGEAPTAAWSVQVEPLVLALALALAPVLDEVAVA